MSRVDPTQNPLQAAALRQHQMGYDDLMRAGPGTPWEDRGMRGLIVAFFATCFMGMFSPTRLFASIRRPETGSDARPFAIGCGILWGIGWVISGGLWYHRTGPHRDPTEFTTFVEASALQFVLAPIAVFFMLRFSTGIYYKMASGELKARFQPALVTNVFAYAMGPSLLALIPYAGPPLALVWIFIVLIVAGRRRMGLGIGSAITDALLSMFASVVVFTVLYLAVWGLWHYWTAPDELPPSQHLSRPQ